MRAACLVLLALVGAPPAGLAAPAACQGRAKAAKKAPLRPATTPAAPSSAAAPASQPAPASAPGLQRSNRMEFDARVVKGERASGAVYLFQRVPRRLPPLVELAPDPLDRIVRPVLRRGVAPASEGPAP